MKQLIRRIWKNKGNKQLLITIPKNSDLVEGDYVSIKKVEEKETFKCPSCNSDVKVTHNNKCFYCKDNKEMRS